MTKILLCPISGGKFVNQAAGLYKLLKHGFVPDSSIGASGGSVIISILLYTLGSPNRIRILLGLLDGSMFVDSWAQPFPTWMIGSVQGAVFRHSYKFLDFATCIFTHSILRRSEIWILTYNKTLGVPHLFTNAPANPILTPTSLSKVQNVREDIPTFCKAILASSSIPGIVPSYQIGEELHSDGGLYSSTPLILFVEDLRKKKSIHFVYLTCINLDENIITEEETIIGMAYNCADAMNRNSCKKDRLLCLDIIGKFGEITYHSSISIRDALEKQKHCHSSLIEVYPEVYQELDITSFTSEQVVKMYDEQCDKIKCRMWTTD